MSNTPKSSSLDSLTTTQDRKTELTEEELKGVAGGHHAPHVPPPSHTPPSPTPSTPSAWNISANKKV